MFKKMLSSLGIGGPSVDTVLDTPTVRPGGLVRGNVHIKGGEVEVGIDYLALGLTTRVETESGDHEYSSNQEFFRVDLSGPFTLAAKEERSLPFEFTIPWETPVTEVYGQHLRGMSMGVRTELAVAKAVDKSDLDALAVAPLPGQLKVLEAFQQLGFEFRSADLERGYLRNVRQELPFYQEIEFYPPRHVGGINQVELTFVASPQGLDIVLEADKRGGMFTHGGDTFLHLQLSNAELDRTDIAAQIDSWIRRIASGGGHHGGGHRRHGHGGHHRGSVAGGIAGGLLGGMILGDILDG